MFQHLIDHAPDGAAVEHLERVHRFTAEWEADASLRLRHGDVSVLEEYDEHGRIHAAITDSDARSQVVARWWKLTTEGSDVVMLTATNESVNELNRAAQRLRLDAEKIVQPIHRATLAD
jgi:tRNA A58 N-methylase Trm61